MVAIAGSDPSYDELRLEITPMLRSSDWTVRVLSGPAPELVGWQEVITPTVVKADLRRLRDRNNWPDLATLRGIGERVWTSVMGAKITAALAASRVCVANAKRKLRLVFVIREGGARDPVPEAIQPIELPVEMLFEAPSAFLALAAEPVPVSRAFHVVPDSQAFVVAPPLRVLAVMSSPKGLPSVDLAGERAALEQGFAGLSGPVHVDYLEQPTRTTLAKALATRPHILHFHGHGGFDFRSQAAEIALLDDKNQQADGLDATTLMLMLCGNDLKLVVLTACSTAAVPELPDQPYSALAFSGFAQSLVQNTSSVSAAVAMQFDFEREAAPVFTTAFYRGLLAGASVDSAVTEARRSVARSSADWAGHRAWVTPVVYWRCIDGRVFQLLAPTETQDLLAARRQAEIYRTTIAGMIRKATAPIAAEVGQYVASSMLPEAEATHAALARDTGLAVRIELVACAAGTRARARVWLHLPAAHPVSAIELVVAHPGMTLASGGPGSAAAGDAAISGQGDHSKIIVLHLAPGLDPPGPGAHEIAVLDLAVADGTPRGILPLTIERAAFHGPVTLSPIPGYVVVVG